jgi:formate hydrogenlyase subunit 4
MISYELPLATVVIALAWRLDRAGVDMPFSLSVINDNPIWNLLGPIGIVGGALLLLTLLIVTPAELSRIPFDSPEAETELAGGLLVEYSGRNLALFYLALGVKTIAMVSLVVTLFFPYPLSGLLALSGISGQIADATFHILKMFVVMFFSVTLIRISIARFRITQVASFYWKALGSIGFIGLLLIMVDAWIGRGGTP